MVAPQDSGEEGSIPSLSKAENVGSIPTMESNGLGLLRKYRLVVRISANWGKVLVNPKYWQELSTQSEEREK